MRSRTLLAAMALWGLASAGEVLWAPSFEAGMRRAKEKNLPTLVDLYTDWCGWCKRLDADVFSTAQVKAMLAKDLVGIKLNPEKDRKNGEKFKVEGFPTVVFTDPDGKELHRVVGYLPPAKFVAEMKKAIELFKEQTKPKVQEVPAAPPKTE
ncbi:MAG TPA: thioredoxin fold domain-containing protein [Planctomycetota bacterium]|nr:thioredoxin fold domain-containing protein [Planctomycetota bacterium]HRR82325.1 thioredoxin fold domain-containing protein [Planctomycetota bacterium]HRT95451.1 thioredoxin fold domain-containing protein [Planctomycetota bacterium]